MKISRTLIFAISGLLFSIILPSCKMGGNSARPAAAASAPAGSSGVPVSLVSDYNVDGIVPDGMQFSGGLDGDGFACSSNYLGAAHSWKGMSFELGTRNPGSNVVTCAGQAIPLPPGKFSKLEMLALGVNGAQDSQTFTVTYSDTNLNQTFTQSLSDWNSPDNNDGETQAVEMDYRNASDGTQDGDTFFIYGYKFNLNPASTATSLVLPDNNNVKVFAITLVP